MTSTSMMMMTTSTPVMRGLSTPGWREERSTSVVLTVSVGVMMPVTTRVTLHAAPSASTTAPEAVRVVVVWLPVRAWPGRVLPIVVFDFRTLAREGYVGFVFRRDGAAVIDMGRVELLTDIVSRVGPYMAVEVVDHLVGGISFFVTISTSHLHLCAISSLGCHRTNGGTIRTGRHLISLARPR